ncbi:DUF1127 domain-containing protein [Reyranella sp.]|jgi:uncharacterized protein YjiS (DUF1127 family)|uniref:DUF1127 domain-containing protein n=1 Tax=Reyranella sp. TaxID=1929291 RepID=UPI002F95603A
MFARPFPMAILLREMMRRLGVPPLSYRRPLDTLRGLDDHLLRDIGISRGPARTARSVDSVAVRRRRAF